jgi:peptide/nickel transport system substrate-binding protein
MRRMSEDDHLSATLDGETTVVLDLTRRQALKRGAGGLTVLSLPGWLAACGGERGDGGDAAGDDAEQASAKLKRGGTLVIAVDALTGNSDPGIFATFGNWMAIDCMARSLTHIDYRRTDPQPAIAERWEVSSDGRTYRFFLREGLEFPDGNPVTAGDAERSFRRLMDEDDPSRPPNVYAIAELGGANIRRVRAVDDTTFEIRLARRDIPFLGRLANPNGAILSEAAIRKEGKDIGRRLVGHGPYSFTSSKPGESITMEAFDGYFGGRPLADKVVLQVLPDPTALTSALRSASAHVSPFVPFASTSTLKRDPKVNVQSGKPFTTVFLFANVGVPLLADPKVREAINLSLDRETMVRQAFNDQAQLPAGLVPPPTPGYDKGLERYSTQDVERARALITEAGAEGKEVEILNQNILFWPRLGQIIEQNLRDIGLRPRSLFLDEATYNERQFDPKGHELAVNQRTQFVPDPDDMLSPLLTSDSFVNQTGTQHFRLDSQEELDERLSTALTETDEQQRRELYVDLQRFLAEEVNVFFPLAYIGLPVTSSAKVGGVNTDAFANYRTFVEKTGFRA